MRWPSPFRDRHKSVELQLTSLIDCVFLLMIYFLWSSSFGVSEKMLPSKLSVVRGSAATGNNLPPPPEADFDDLVIRLLPAGAGVTWQVNGSPVATAAELRRLLASIARIKRDAPVILDPDPEVSLGDVIDAFDATRKAGFAQVKFAASAAIER